MTAPEEHAAQMGSSLRRTMRYRPSARRAKAHGKGASCSVMLPKMRAIACGGMSRFESGSPARPVGGK